MAESSVTDELPHEPQDPGPPWRRAVLFVEDDRQNQALVARFLRDRADVRLFVAPDGSAALQLAAAHQPDLILLDRHLPDISGEEVVRRLKDRPETAQIPVVLQSGDTAGPGRPAFVALGVVDFLDKPYSRDRFNTIIDRFCGDDP